MPCTALLRSSPLPRHRSVIYILTVGREGRRPSVNAIGPIFARLSFIAPSAAAPCARPAPRGRWGQTRRLACISSTAGSCSGGAASTRPRRDGCGTHLPRAARQVKQGDQQWRHRSSSRPDAGGGTRVSGGRCLQADYSVRHLWHVPVGADCGIKPPSQVCSSFGRARRQPHVSQID